MWGSLAFIRILDIKRPKFGPKANKCVFLSFAKDSDSCRDAEYLEDKLIKDKGLSLKDVSENVEKSFAQDESILQKLKVLMLKKKLQKV